MGDTSSSSSTPARVWKIVEPICEGVVACKAVQLLRGSLAKLFKGSHKLWNMVESQCAGANAWGACRACCMSQLAALPACHACSVSKLARRSTATHACTCSSTQPCSKLQLVLATA